MINHNAIPTGRGFAILQIDIIGILKKYIPDNITTIGNSTIKKFTPDLPPTIAVKISQKRRGTYKA